MRRLIPIVLLALVVSGCATSSMKSTPFYSGSERVYTGRIEDRVNLWPIGYYREPALSVLWPLYGWTNDTGMEKAEVQMNADRLDSKIDIQKHENVTPKGRTNRWYEVTGETRAHDSSWRLSGLSTSDRWIRWFASDDGKTVTGEDTSDFGNFFAYKSDYNRTVNFDYVTKKKLSDEETGESGLFCNFFWHAKHEASKGREYDMKSILWRFWHYEKQNGDVTVDSFPFFTYDSKTNGYSKTSLCWRLFRSEYDPKADKRAVDFLFLPVWR